MQCVMHGWKANDLKISFKLCQLHFDYFTGFELRGHSGTTLIAIPEPLSYIAIRRMPHTLPANSSQRRSPEFR